MKMIRKQLYIEAAQDKAIKAAVKKSGETESEFIRKAVEDKLAASVNERRRKLAWKKIQETWAKRDALGQDPGERDWKREDLYERH
jgi:hypothetical protein